MKGLKWMGSSKKDLLAFPKNVQQEIGYALHMAQVGEIYKSAKLFKGFGSGVYEIVSDFNTDTWRSVYVVKLDDNVYVLHAFQKKSKKGIATPKKEISIIEERMKNLKQILKNQDED